jgi:hypothetical protein
MKRLDIDAVTFANRHGFIGKPDVCAADGRRMPNDFQILFCIFLLRHMVQFSKQFSDFEIVSRAATGYGRPLAENNNRLIVSSIMGLATLAIRARFAYQKYAIIDFYD